jgi:putative aldouronate transport system permease protein
VKKKLSITLICALTVGAVSGCAGETAQRSENSVQKSERTKFSMSVNTSGNKHAERTADVNKEKWVNKKAKRAFVLKHWPLYLISIPGLLYFVIFKYIPLFGSSIAFQDYNIFKGIADSPWVGLAHFQRMFEYEEFLVILKNTLLIGLYDLVFAFPIPIVLALLLTEIRFNGYKRILQTVIYMPHFLSWVIVGGIIIGVLSPTTGIVNHVLGLFHIEPIYFLGEDSYIFDRF